MWDRYLGMLHNVAMLDMGRTYSQKCVPMMLIRCS
jgi:hypothetical protein